MSKFNVTLDSIHRADDNITFGRLNMSVEAVEATGSNNIKDIVDPAPDFLDKLTARAAYNDSLDQENIKKILAELKANGFDVMETNGPADDLDKPNVSKLPTYGSGRDHNNY